MHVHARACVCAWSCREAYEFVKLCKTDAAAASLTMRDFLSQRGYSEGFRQWYLLPEIAAVWSASADDALAFPAHTFLQFCTNHSLAQVRVQLARAGGAVPVQMLAHTTM